MSRSINNVNYDEVDRHAVCQTTMSKLDPPLMLRTLNAKPLVGWDFQFGTAQKLIKATK